MAFLRNITNGRPEAASRRACRETARRTLGSGAGACLLLALLAFGGGLLLAFYESDTTPEAGVPIVAESEILYARPQALEELSKSAPEAETAQANQVFDLARPSRKRATTDDAPSLSLWVVPPHAADENNLAPSNFAVGQSADLNSIGAVALSPTGASSTAGSAALVLPAVPEPATWVLLAGAGAMLGVRSLRKFRIRK